MKLHLPVKLFRSVLSCMAAVSFFTFASASSTCCAAEEEENDLMLLSERDYPNGSITYTQRQTAALTLRGYESICFKDICSSTDRGAIYNYGNAIFTLSDNGNVTFSGNSAYLGGAIYSYFATFALSDNGAVFFSGNSATSGGAIYNDCCDTFTLKGNQRVTFSGNSATSGGAIFNHGTFTLIDNGTVTFKGNTATFGGAVRNCDATFTLSNNGNVTFSGNTATSGGAIDNFGTFTLCGNGDVTFSGNSGSRSTVGGYAPYGGAVFNGDRHNHNNPATFTLSGNGNVLFEKNVENNNGAYRLRSIYSNGETLNLSASAGKSILFRDSVYAEGTVNLNQDGKGDIIFTGAATEADLREVKGGVDGTAAEILNSRTSELATNASLYGGRLIVEDGAILKGQGITATVGSDATVRVNDGTLDHSGYALTFNAGTTFEAEGVSTVTAGSVNLLSGSTLSFVLGEVNLTAAAMTLTGALNTGTINISIGGSYDLDAGHTYALLTASDYDTSAWTADNISLTTSELSFDALTWHDGTLYLNYAVNPYPNSSITFTTRQTKPLTLVGYEAVYFKDISTTDVGAINNSGSFTLSNNGEVSFSGNFSGIGGVIDNIGTFLLSGNGAVSLSGNSSGSGCLIFNHGTFMLSSNGVVTFSRNRTGSVGAISNWGDFTLSGNENVTFSGNCVFSSGGVINNSYSFTLRNNGDVLFEKNAEISGGTYRLRSIYSKCILNLSASEGKSILFRDSVYARGTVNLNTDGVGDIIFTGATTEADLREVKGGIAGSAEEILNSRSSVLDAVVTLGGGILRVCDGASLTVEKLTAANGAALVLQDASFTATGNSTLAAVTAFGNATLTARTGATLTLKQAITNNGFLTIGGTLDVSALTLDTILTAASYIDVNGNSGASGFARIVGYSVQLVNGGTVINSNASVRHGGLTLTLNSNGTATTTSDGTVDYGTYYLNCGSEALSSMLNASNSALRTIRMASGTTVAADTGNLQGVFSVDSAQSLTVGNGGLSSVLTGNVHIEQLSATGSLITDNSTTLSIGSTAADNACNINVGLSAHINFETDSPTEMHVGSIYTGSSNNYDRTVLVGEGVTLHAASVVNSWGMRSLTVNGTLDIAGALQLATANNPEGTNLVTGSGTITAGSLNVSNWSDFNTINVHELRVAGDAGIYRPLTISGGTTSIQGNTTVGRELNITGGHLVLGDEMSDTATLNGSINLSAGELTLNGSATLSNNLHQTGGTLNLHGALQVRNGGTLTVTHFAAANGSELVLHDASFTSTGDSTLAAVAISGNATIIAQNNATLTLQQVMTNNGTLTIGGTLDVSALTLNTTAATHIDVNGNSGASGFAGEAAYSVQLVNGGTTVSNNATVRHGSLALMLNSEGTATSGGTVDYSTYLLTGTATATTAAIHGKSSTATITLTGGTLTVNDTATVNATAGKMMLSGGTLNGTLSNTTITATSGTLAAALSGNNTLTGSNYALQRVISNSGTLTIGGMLDVSALALNTIAATHIDVNGNTGASGFAKAAGYSVQLVNGGTTLNNNATIKHGNRTLMLNSDGTATLGGAVNYFSYLLTGSDTVSVSSIRSMSSAATIAQAGGTLIVNDDTTVNATSGSINLQSGTMKGVITDTVLTASGGTVEAYVRGNKAVNINGNVVLGGYVAADINLNSGRLTAENLDLESGQSLCFNGGRLSADVTTTVGSNIVLARNATMNGDLTLDGGNVVLNGNMLIVDGTLNLLSHTAVDIGALGLGSHKLLAFDRMNGSLENLTVDSKAYRTELSCVDNTLMLTVRSLSDKLEWAAASGTWETDALFGDGIFGAESEVSFLSPATVTVSGTVAPAAMLVGNETGTVTFKGTGSISGDVALIKDGAGTLTLNSSNSYTGGTVINAGTVNAGGAESFGTGGIALNGGTLNLSFYAVENDITVDGSAVLKGTAYQGALRINADLGEGTNISLAKNATLSHGTVSGVLAGTAGVKVTGDATLAGKNTYKGTTTVARGGTLHLTGSVAGNIAVAAGGTLDTSATPLSLGLNKTLTLNDGSIQTGSVIVNSGANLVVKGKTSVTDAVTLYNGTATFDSTAAANVLTGNGVFSVTGHQVNLTTRGTVKTAAAAGLTIHSGSLTLTSSKDYTGTLALKGGTLNLGSLALTNAVKVAGSSNLKGTAYKGALTIAANMGAGTNISIAKTATLSKGKVTGVLTGAAGVKVTGEATLAGKNTYKGTTAVAAGALLHLTGTVAGNYSVAGTLDASQKAITLGSGKTMTVADGGVVTGKVTVNSGATLTVKGNKSKLGTTVVNGGTAVLNSTAATIQATGSGVATVYGKKLTLGTTKSTLKMAAKEAVNLNSGKLVVNAVSSTYTGNLVAKGGTLDLASRTVTNNVYLYKATLAHAGALRGTLCVRDAAARYSGSLTLTSNNKLNFSAGSKLTVTGTLTLKGGTALTLAGSGWKAGSYTIMSAGTLSGKAATAFKVAKLSGFTSALTNSGKNVVLTLRKAATKAAAAPDLAAAPALAAEPMADPTATAPALTAETAAMADALVQADWAVVDTARAFTSGIRNRSTGTLTPDGKGALWMNAIGSLARHSSVNGHSGSQVNLYGGAVGAEHHIGEHHSIGAAVGGTHANIGNTPMGKLRQNTTHIALYGNSRMGSKFSADWAAAFGSTNAHGNLGDARAKWQQNSTELTARLTYAEMLNDNTQLRTFAGLDYDATDADRTNGGKTGSVQALRGEFGMGLTHATETYTLYGEVGMVGDMVRHDPVAEADGFRLKGANPGRIGMKATLGGSIRLNDTWSANASYNLETAADATMQSVNVGASRKF